MSLRSALLGLLHAEPMSGYDLNRILDETFGYVWTAQHSQIYPALRQMEREGLIEAEVEKTGGRERRVYRLLDRGHEELLTWIGEPVAYSAERDVAHLKASMIDLLEPEHAEAFFRTHMSHYRQRLATWERRIQSIQSGESPILRARLRSRPSEQHEAMIAFKILSYEGSARRARAEIEWAEEGLATVAALRSALAAAPS